MSKFNKLKEKMTVESAVLHDNVEVLNDLARQSVFGGNQPPVGDSNCTNDACNNTACAAAATNFTCTNTQCNTKLSTNPQCSNSTCTN